ncbi:hypothetical protein C8F01DRAFT_1085211 [Mycena amicta]|nr:hypothetical protein C8F01DRAFT_1085211 [Mycena amicta]
MQFNIFSAFILASAALGSVQAAAVSGTDTIERRGGAGATCTNWQIVPNTADITTTCLENDGTGLSTRTSIGQGNAGASCTFSGIFQSGSNVFVTSVTCTTENGGTTLTSDFNLGNCFTNNDGLLDC